LSYIQTWLGKSATVPRFSAVKAKGDGDLLRGIAQAELYQLRFHCLFLAVDVSVLDNSIVEIAIQKNIGILAVSEDVQVVHVPPAVTPMRRSIILSLAKWRRESKNTEKGRCFYVLKVLQWRQREIRSPRH
jgi:hypothetical protein